MQRWHQQATEEDLPWKTEYDAPWVPQEPEIQEPKVQEAEIGFRHPDNGLIVAPFNSQEEAYEHFEKHGHFLRDLKGEYPTYPKIDFTLGVRNQNTARGSRWYYVPEDYRYLLPANKQGIHQKMWPCDFQGKDNPLPKKAAKWSDDAIDLVQMAVACDVSLQSVYETYISSLTTKEEEDHIRKMKALTAEEVNRIFRNSRLMQLAYLKSKCKVDITEAKLRSLLAKVK
jgi:hypothetical protein